MSNNEKIKFSIITPTLLRDSLLRTCRSIDEQSYSNYEHIVLIDLPNINITDNEKNIIVEISQSKNRKIINLDRRYNDFGNTPRNKGGTIATGDYLLYLDDDDFHVNDTLSEIYNQLIKYGDNLPDMAVFRCIRKGKEFTNFPPAVCQTVSCQWIHKRIINNNLILWPTHDKSYYSDGNFLESVKKITTPVLLKTEKVLVAVDVYSGGKKSTIPSTMDETQK